LGIVEPRKFNYIAAQMTTLEVVQHQRVTSGALFCDPYLTRINLGQIRVKNLRAPIVGLPVAQQAIGLLGLEEAAMPGRSHEKGVDGTKNVARLEMG